MSQHLQIILAYFIRESIPGYLISCFSGLDSTKQVNLSKVAEYFPLRSNWAFSGFCYLFFRILKVTTETMLIKWFFWASKVQHVAEAIIRKLRNKYFPSKLTNFGRFWNRLYLNFDSLGWWKTSVGNSYTPHCNTYLPTMLTILLKKIIIFLVVVDQ